MHITWRTLAALIEKMSDEQKDSDVTVEDRYEGECFAGELRIAGPDHTLDEGTPVIFFPADEDGRRDDIDGIVFDIGL